MNNSMNKCLKVVLYSIPNIGVDERDHLFSEVHIDSDLIPVGF